MPLHKKGSKGILYITKYIDDDLVVGNPEAINDAIKQLKKKG